MTAAPGSSSPACHSCTSYLCISSSACQAVLSARPMLPSVASQEGDGAFVCDIVQDPLDVGFARLSWQPATCIRVCTTRSQVPTTGPKASPVLTLWVHAVVCDVSASSGGSNSALSWSALISSTVHVSTPAQSSHTASPLLSHRHSL